MSNDSINGTQSAALLLMALGEDEAAEVLKYMGAKEVQQLGAAMATLGSVSRDRAGEVLDAFITDIEDQSPFGVGTEEYVRKVLSAAFGPAKANAFLDRILSGDDGGGLDALKWMSAREVASIVDGEHPQIIAIIVACLESDVAAEVVDQLPEEVKCDVVIRIAHLSDVQQTALAEIENLIQHKAMDASKGSKEKVGGDKVAADIINALDSEAGEGLLEQIKEKDEELSERIRDKMFDFDVLLTIDDRGIQAILREISNDLLVTALKGCDPQISEKVFGNMSKRAATLLREDMEARGPTKLSEVEESQKEILETVKRLADNGDIDLGKGDDEYV